MNLFSNQRARRNTAFLVLPVWSLALASGFANACLLEAPCLKVCDDGSRSLPTQRSGVDPADHGMAAVIAVLWAVHAPVVSVSNHVDDRQFPVPGPPLQVLYARLTL